jgi:hypothetical protein
MRWPNCTPVGALGLYSGGRLRLWHAVVLTLAVLAVSDLGMYALYGYRPFNRWAYIAFLVYPLLGRLLARATVVVRVGVGSFLGALVFYLVTNFAVWYTASEIPGSPYEPTPTGLLKCYIAALPFFGYTLAGDLGFSAAMFGAHAWLTRTAEEPAPATGEPGA